MCLGCQYSSYTEHCGWAVGKDTMKCEQTSNGHLLGDHQWLSPTGQLLWSYKEYSHDTLLQEL